MDNFLREIESEDVVIYTDQVYSADLLNKCREIHRKLVTKTSHILKGLRTLLQILFL